MVTINSLWIPNLITHIGQIVSPKLILENALI